MVGRPGKSGGLVCIKLGSRDQEAGNTNAMSIRHQYLRPQCPLIETYDEGSGNLS